MAAALCNSGYSYREVARMIGDMSYVAARDAYFALMTSLPREEKKYRRSVAVDGCDVTIGKEVCQLWLARDVESGEILSFQASPGARAEDGARFLSSVAVQCSNKPFLRLGEGTNHPRGIVNFDLYFQSSHSQSIMVKLGRLFLGQ